MKAKLFIIFFCLPFLVIAQKVKEQTNKELTFINLFSTDMKEGVACYRIPAILTAKNGDLIVAIDERVPSCGDLRSNDDVNIVIRRSKNKGKSWTKITTIVDYPKGESASDPSMILDKKTGEIFLFFNYMNLTTAKGEYYLKVISSKDHGKSWSKPIDITTQISKPSWKKDFKFITSGRGIQTKSRQLLHTLVNLEKGLFVFGSKDHGQSWFLIDTPIQPGDESKIIELNDSRWMINSRVNKAGLRYVHTSEDEGQHWTSKPDSSLIDPSCNASILRLKKKKYTNVLLFSNANTSNKRENLTIKVSWDNGKTWSKGKTIYSGKAAYSSMTLLKNGDVGLFFEKDGYRENVFVRLSLDWLLDTSIQKNLTYSK